MSLSGNRVSTAIDVGSYGATGPDLKIKWLEILPAGTSITIETGTSDSDSTPPATWHEQTNGSSITNLPADLTGKYLYYKASLTTTDDAITPELKWLVIYDGVDATTAAARVEFNNEIKAVPSTGTVTFTGVEPGTDLPYTIYALTIDGVDKFENIHPAGFADTVTVVDAGVTETVSIIFPNTVVTQQYLEVAVQPSSTPNAVVTQQYIEVGYVDGGSTPAEPTPGNFKLYLGTTPIGAIYLGTQNITDVILGG